MDGWMTNEKVLNKLLHAPACLLVLYIELSWNVICLFVCLFVNILGCSPSFSLSLSACLTYGIALCWWVEVCVDFSSVSFSLSLNWFDVFFREYNCVFLRCFWWGFWSVLWESICRILAVCRELSYSRSSLRLLLRVFSYSAESSLFLLSSLALPRIVVLLTVYTCCA